MNQRVVVVLLASFCTLAPRPILALDRPAVTVKGGSEILAGGGYWGSDGAVWCAAFDFSSAKVTAALVAGTSRAEGTYKELRENMTSFYLAPVVRLTTERGGNNTAGYVMAGFGPTRTELRSRMYDWRTNTSEVEKETGWGGTGIFGAGLIIFIRDSPVSFVAEVYGLLPVVHSGPGLSAQAFGSAGVRLSLGH
jgi:hypothetical protein